MCAEKGKYIRSISNKETSDFEESMTVTALVDSEDEDDNIETNFTGT